MDLANLFREYLGHLFAGRRAEARDLMQAAYTRGISANTLLTGMVWQAMEQVDSLFRQGHITNIVYHMALRINRSVADRFQTLLTRQVRTGRQIVVTSGPGEAEELGAQILADMFEADGWTVWFLGSGVPHDEVLQLASKNQPDLLCIYGAHPSALPEIRRLIETMRQTGTCPNTRVMVVGGVFKRAEGLAEELRVNYTAADIPQALQTAGAAPRNSPADRPAVSRRRVLRENAPSAV